MVTKTVDANEVSLVEGERVFHVLRQQHARVIVAGPFDVRVTFEGKKKPCTVSRNCLTVERSAT